MKKPAAADLLNNSAVSRLANDSQVRDPKPRAALLCFLAEFDRKGWSNHV